MEQDLAPLIRTYITALHILHHNNVLDAFGNLSVRNPNDPTTFLMSRDVAPALVCSPADIIMYRIADASPVDPASPNGFVERYIHSEIYKRYAGVQAVVNSQSTAVLPFTVCTVPLSPVIRLAGFLTHDPPVFDITKFYNQSDTQDLLVRNAPLGAALAAEFSEDSSAMGDPQVRPDHLVVLMRSHGFTTVTTANTETAVFQAIYTKVNAEVHSSAVNLEHAFEGAGAIVGVQTLRTPHAGRSWESFRDTVFKSWDLWAHQVRASPLYQNTLNS